MLKKISAPSLFLLIVLIGFPQISETIYSPILPDIAYSLQASDNVVQLTLGIYFLGFAAGVLVWGRLSDFIGRRPALLWGILVYGLGCLGCYWSGSAAWLLVSRFVQAFGASTGSVVTQTVLRESMDGTKRHNAFARISAALAFTPAIGPLVGGWVDEALGFRAVFVVLIGLSLALFACAFLFLPETKDPKMIRVSILSVAARLASDSRVWLFGFLIGATNGILFSYYAEAPFIYIGFFHMTPGIFGFLGIFVALSSLLGAMLSRKLAVRYPAEKTIFLGAALTVAGALCLSGCARYAASSSLVSLAGITLSLFILLLGVGTMIPGCLSLALAAYSDVLGTAGAVFGLGYYLVVSLITSGMSVLHNGSLQTMPLYFLILALFMVWASRTVMVKQTVKSVSV